MIFDALNWGAFIWFIFCWTGYTLYTKKKAQSSDCLTSVLYQHRAAWVRNMLGRDNRIVDISLLGNLSRMVNFLASTTIFLLAGLLTALNSVDSLVDLLSGHDFIISPTKADIQFKIFILIFIFAFAFFRFTWSMRQHTFCSILFGAAPYIPDADSAKNIDCLIKHIARVSDRAGHEFNYGVRAYYFALAFLTWFINPWLFILSCSLVVMILYRREFRSTVLDILIDSEKSFNVIQTQKMAQE